MWNTSLSYSSARRTQASCLPTFKSAAAVLLLGISKFLSDL